MQHPVMQVLSLVTTVPCSAHGMMHHVHHIYFTCAFTYTHGITMTAFPHSKVAQQIASYVGICIHCIWCLAYTDLSG